ncbi:MAG: arginine--tRNA ligase [Pedosphaera sp.]|nr:arginine--tRNA ligase [Pedosphaera sp.]
MILRQIEQRLQLATLAILPDVDVSTLFIRPCLDRQFGDYQCNALMGQAKSRKLNPRQLATDVLAKLDVSEWCDRVDIAGAGFLNFRLSTAAISRVLESAARGEHNFFHTTDRPRTIVIDFSSPNIAKPMHIGHIRSTILGECLTRTLRLLGHRVITDNHIGDWGTQFGKLIVGWKSELDRDALRRDAIAEMERLYKSVNAKCDADPAVIESARKELVNLQAGDPENLSIWREMIALSQNQFDTIYGRLGVKFDHTYGESFYNPRLKAVVEDLRAKEIVRESEGAQVAFFDDIPSLKDHPAIVQKSDGGANYTTTDLATLEFRLQTWNPDEIVYVTDGRQQLHFQQLFSIFRRWYPKTQTRLDHAWFGSILGEDGKPFKTRSGETVKLADLLNEAEERALTAVQAKNPDLAEATQREIARIVGLGAVKYADLLPNRQSDYIFSWDKMLALQGNTAPYLQYAYTRVQSIFRKVEFSRADVPSLQMTAPEEQALARHLLNYGLAIEAVAGEFRPNYLCNYLYELAGHFARFYEVCPVLKAADAERDTRLVLCSLTARVLRQGLELLGIEVAEQM